MNEKNEYHYVSSSFKWYDVGQHLIAWDNRTISKETSNKTGFCEPDAGKVVTLRIPEEEGKLFGSLPLRRELSQMQQSKEDYKLFQEMGLQECLMIN